ncbi:MAG TPA: response regulator, partial [Bacteroidia bacterium]|nr:response regulator [Bacteroidia bacterium]
MKLDYKILWLDDKMEDIQEDQYDTEIKAHLEELGFNPLLDMVSNEKDFFDLLDDSYDLILTDYHLNQSGNKVRDGDVIVTEVRGKSIFTEIMFYSAQGEVVDTIKLDRITFVDTKKISGSGHMAKVLKKAIELID